MAASAALSQGQAQISWQAQYCRKAKYRFRGRHSTFARSSKDFVAGAALSQGHLVAGAALCAAASQGQVQVSWQAQHFSKVKYRFGGRRSTFSRSSTDLVAGAALSQGQVQI